MSCLGLYRMENKVSTFIKTANREHYQTIADIYNEYIILGTATMDETIKTVEDIASWIGKFNKNEALYVLEKENRIIGWGIIKRYSDREGYRYTGETAVYLTQSEIGKGYGTTLKKYLIEQCKLRNYHHLVAKIISVNKGSITYNLKQGYTIVGTQKEIGFRNNQWQDVTIMQLILRK